MNIGQLEKLNNLIKSSPILNPQERTEWLALLDLMNDKQLGELERILATSGKSQVASQRTASQVHAASSQVPNLSHILNLPHIRDAAANQTQKPSPPPPPAISPASAKFNARLKSLLEEKELPSAPVEAELPVSTKIVGAQPELAKPAPPAVPTPPVPARKPTGETLKQAPVPANLSSAIAKPSNSDNSARPGQPVKSGSATLGVWKSSEDLKRQTKELLEGNKLGRAKFSSGLGNSNTVASGLSFSGAPVIPKELAKDILSRKQKIADMEGRESAMPAVRPIKRPAGSSAPVVPEKFTSVDELATLTSVSLQKSGLEPVAAGIKNLAALTGIYEVMFALEKSPLYQAYIATGLKLLKDQTAFEDIAGDNGYLNREDFESVSDLLRKVQAA